MGFKDVKIGGKLIIAFVAVIVIFGGISAYQVFSLRKLSRLQDEGAGRAEDSQRITEIDMILDETYTVIADGIINRNIEETRKDFNAIETEFEGIEAEVREMADTGEEKEWAEEFAQHMDEYFGVFDDQLFPIIEKEEDAFQRAMEEAMILGIEADVGEVYAVMADGIINRNLAETIADLNSIKEKTVEDIATVHGLADTDEEKKLAQEFESHFTEYISTYEEDVIPVLRKGGSNMGQLRALDEELDGLRNETIDVLHRIVASLEEEAAEAVADEAEIRRLDGEIDALREEAAEPLDKIVASLKAEMIEADELFDAIAKRTTLLTVIISVIAVLIAVLLALVITRSITKPVYQGVAFAEKMADGDLSGNLNIERKDEIGILAKALNRMTFNLRDMVSEIRDSSEQVASTSEELSATSEQLAEGAQQQASTLEETSASVEELTASVEQVSEHSQAQASAVEESTANMDQMRSSVESVSNTLESVVAAMKSILESSKHITGIISVISDIADQTNLLALNASIETARAGEHGRGFAVVADEVSKLADRSASSTKEIGGLIDESDKNVTSGNEMISQLSSAIEQQISSIKELGKAMASINEMSQSISASTEEQTTNSKQVSVAIESVNELTQQASSSAEEMSSSTEELSSMATQLQGMVARFKTDAEETEVAGAITGPVKSTSSPDKGRGAKKAASRDKEENSEVTGITLKSDRVA